MPVLTFLQALKVACAVYKKLRAGEAVNLQTIIDAVLGGK
jgi:hypothetical protein